MTLPVDFLLTQSTENPQKVRKTPAFAVKVGVLGGDKRDRTADLLNAIGLLCKLTNIYTTI